MRALILFFCISIYSSFSFSVDYQFPVLDPFKATFLSSAADAMISDEGMNIVHKKIYSKILGRDNLKYFEGRDFTTVRYAYHKGEDRPLVFIFAGLGGSAVTGLANYYQKVLYKAGFNSVTIPSPYLWKFSMSHLGSATPGYMERDQVDFYDFLKRVYDYRKKLRAFKSSKNYLLGYSMGGLQAVYISEYDEKQKDIQFEKVVVVNPPIDLYESASKLDQLFPVYKQLSEKRRYYMEKKLWHLIIDLGKNFSQRAPTDEEVVAIIQNLPFKTYEYKALIGKSFLETLAAMILVSEQVRDWGAIPIYYDIRSPQPSLNAAREYSFIKYFDEILFPDLVNGPIGLEKTREELIEKMGLIGKLDYLKNTDKIKIFHNEDDIIVSNASIQLLKDVVPKERLKLYPLGGHLGNVWFPSNVNDLIMAFMQ
ncbi:MAG: alpha/beta fold hydrolase [Bdellovibrionota bacterium]|nr:alpha/beta fold hydrolase [Bdellovibrionota bacterium]